MLEFKCRCCMCIHQKTTGVELMSGAWKEHMSLVQLVYPKGLHRKFYVEVWDADTLERITEPKLVKHHYSRGKYVFG